MEWGGSESKIFGIIEKLFKLTDCVPTYFLSDSFLYFSVFGWSKLLGDLKYIKEHVFLDSSWLCPFKINHNTVILGHILLGQILPWCRTGKWRAHSFYPFPSKEIWQDHHGSIHCSIQWAACCIISSCC